MSSPAPVQPLRINKETPSKSPLKTTATAGASRALTEISSAEQRHNSPSLNLQTKISNLGDDSSPYNDSSPSVETLTKSAPHKFWQSRQESPGRDIENMNFTWSTNSTSNRRSSIENLKRASRVKNSNMFAKEQQMAYDPTSPPPMMSAIASDVRPSPGQVAKAVEVHCDEVVPLEASVIDEFGEVRAKSASASPTKSAFSNNPRFHNDRIVEKLTESRNLRPVGFPKHHIRNNKSVTFDAAPPQINEYEQATPDPSVGTVSREGSYDTISGSEGQDDSYLHGASADQDTTFDNVDEDGMTIPVIEPESWRSMTPEKAKPTRRDLVPDPFDSNEIDHTRLTPSMLSPRESSQTTSRSGSTASNESRRPLPPLPPSLADSVSPSSSSNTLMGGQATKDSPASPFATGVTKDDIKSSPRMSLAERLKLMGWQDQQDSASNAQEDQRERRMRRAMHKEPAQETSTKPESADKALPPTTAAAPSTGFFNLANYRMPKINRESILAKVRGLGGAADANGDDSSETGSSPIRGNEGFALNPDEPVPSIEHDPILEEDEEEYEVSGFDADDISELYNNEAPVAGDREVSPMSAVSSKDDGSVYTDTAEAVEAQMKQRSETSGSLTPKMAATTVDDVFGASKLEPHPDQSIMSLPDFGFESVLDQHDFGFDMKSYLTPSPPSTPVKEQAAHPPRDFRAPSMTSQLSELPAPRMPGYAEGMSEPQTPESVIRRSFVDSSRSPESPAVEEPVATVKASGGGKLKIRPSLTPADAEAMATARRQVSGQMPPPPMPAIPARHNGHRYSAMDLNAEKLSTPAHRDIGGAAATGSSEPIDSGNPGLCTLERKLTQKQKLVLQQLDLPLSSLSEELSMSLEADFDRVIENQKVQFDLAIAELSQRYANMAGLGISQGDDHPFGDHGQASRTDASAAIDAAKQIVANTYRPVQRGYLMRQNTKVVHASSNEEPALPTVEMPASRATKSAGNSPVKRPRESMTKAWQAEPWNGKARRQSIKHATRPTAPTKMDGPVPPLPGQESAVQAEADTSVPSILEQDSGEKGRLFVKVMGVKDLDLPLARGERTYFCLTLDNGLHCVTTSWLELGKNCPIGQEFELVVLQDLEFQLTLQAKLDAPKPPPPSLQPTTPSSRSGSPTKNKPSTFSRMFGSPKKREKKYEDEQRAADARQAQLDAKQRAMMNQTPQTSYELLQGLVARDGSFGRSYVSLKEYENKCYGRPIVVDVACFNEWGTEQVFSSSIKSKASTTNGLTGVQSRRRAPYKIGKLEVQLLFVPKPKAKTPARDGEKVAEVEMPKSLNAAVREMREFEERSAREFEGFLSQQGGDCPYWRRRFFKLKAHKLTAFHESTRQPRANINLTKAAKIVGDRATLTQSDSSETVVNSSTSPQKKSKSRRKSAFAEEEEGYMMVEEGFRVRFQNGEVIDFYADSKEEKERWMDALSEVVGKDAKEGTWCDLVVQRERSTQAASQKKAPAITTTTPAVQKPLPKPQSNALPPPPTTPSHQKPELRKEYPMAPPPPPPPSASASSKLMFSAAPAPPPPVRAETEQSRAAPMPRKPNFRADYHAEMNDRRTSQTNDGFSPARPSSQPGFQTSARLELGDAKASTTGARDFAQHVAYGMGTEQMLGFDASRRTPQAVRTGLVSPVKKPANLIKKKEVGKAGAGSRPKSMLF